jgi:hypothetical protein
MTSYRFQRRSFLQAICAAAGLDVLLGTLEAVAQGATSPPRLLVTHWPVGAVTTGWAPTSGSVGGSAILKPFADTGLAADVTAFRGFRISQLASPSGGGHEAGTVKVMTGVPSPGTRAGEPEQDDAFAGGPSFDQIFLKNVPALRAPGGGTGYANSICDSRVDVGEISTQCLSYDYATIPVRAANAAATTTQNAPLMPILSPLQQWTNLFQAFIPGNGGSSGATALAKAIVGKRSVLDFALGELARLRRIAPAGARDNIDIHSQAIRNAERQLGGASSGGTTGSTGADAGNPSCIAKPAQPMGLGAMGGGSGNAGLQYSANLDQSTTDDTATLAAVGKLHTDIFKAAFICDILRVGTFQWCPGTNHVAFKGMMPGDPDGIYQHNPTSHRINHEDCLANPLGAVAQFLANVHTWYNQQHAAIFADWKTALDGFGNSLLDFTVVPFVTEVEDCGGGWNNMAALIIGGKRLGFTHNVYKTGNFTINQFWGTVGQAFGYTNTEPVGAPIDGLWSAPP